MQKPEWLFFDLGSTLIDETEAYAHRIRETVHDSHVSPAQFSDAMLHFCAQGLDGYKEALNLFHLKKTLWHSTDEHPYDDCPTVLKTLRQRGFRLGIIANQLPGTEQRLRNWNLAQYFDVIAASSEIGAAKPDPTIFLYALGQAGCAPENAVMIGDRIGNDILPAKALGMKTVRILSGPAAAYRPLPDPADSLIYTLSELLNLM